MDEAGTATKDWPPFVTMLNDELPPARRPATGGGGSVRWNARKRTFINSGRINSCGMVRDSNRQGNNSQALRGAPRLFADHGATRLTFARELKLADIARISEGLADTSLELEAFIAREYCVFSSAFCTVTHGFGQWTHFCCSHTERNLRNLAAGAQESLPCATTQWADTPQYREAALTLQRCGLCALGALQNARVKYLKVPGRQCRFCAWRRHDGGMRTASLERIRDDIALALHHPVHTAYILDSAVNTDGQHFERFARAVAEADAEKRLGLRGFIDLQALADGQLELKPGDVVIFDALTLHAAWSNISPRSVRVSFDVRYLPRSLSAGCSLLSSEARTRRP